DRQGAGADRLLRHHHLRAGAGAGPGPPREAPPAGGGGPPPLRGAARPPAPGAARGGRAPGAQPGADVTSHTSCQQELYNAKRWTTPSPSPPTCRGCSPCPGRCASTTPSTPATAGRPG